MKIIHLALFTALISAPFVHGDEAENRYNVLGRLLRPFISVFAKDTKSPNRAFTLTARLEEMTDLPPAFAGNAKRSVCRAQQ